MRYRPYTGVGSRETPEPVLDYMTRVAERLDLHGFTLRSGGADGADTAFEEGALVNSVRTPEILVPWRGFNGRDVNLPGYYHPGDFDESVLYRAEEIAALLHPAWERCSDAARKLHRRNVQQVLGPSLSDHSMFVICWTKRGYVTGGTATAIRVACKYEIPVYNLGAPRWESATLLEIVKDLHTRV